MHFIGWINNITETRVVTYHSKSRNLSHSPPSGFSCSKNVLSGTGQMAIIATACLLYTVVVMAISRCSNQRVPFLSLQDFELLRCRTKAIKEQLIEIHQQGTNQASEMKWKEVPHERMNTAELFPFNTCMCWCRPLEPSWKQRIL